MPGCLSPCRGRIQNQRNKVATKLHHEGVLTTTISTFNNRIRGLQGNIRSLQQREQAIQSDLDQKRAELAAVQNKLQVARDRLARLRARLALAMKQLAARLVDEYEADEPDMVTGDPRVARLRRPAHASRLHAAHLAPGPAGGGRGEGAQGADRKQAKELAVLEQKEQDAANAILAQRNAVAASKGKLVSSRDSLQRARDGRRWCFRACAPAASTRRRTSRAMLAQQSRIQNQLQAPSAPFQARLGPS